MPENPSLTAGRHMAEEFREAPAVFSRAVRRALDANKIVAEFAQVRAYYTVARGSSDAAANILSYEFMRETGRPTTSLPPSVFSIGSGIDLTGAGVLVISQSGASDDLVKSTAGAKSCGAVVVGITNVENSPVEAAADAIFPIGAGVENAIPATKTVIGSIAAGMAVLSYLCPTYRAACETAARAFDNLSPEARHPITNDIIPALLKADTVYVIGRGVGLGAAQEVALKLKETCALHAEAFSASEVLHGPLQLVAKPMTVLILDTGDQISNESLDTAETRFKESGANVFRIASEDMGVGPLAPAAAAAVLLFSCYPIVLEVALALGLDPDRPDKLAKVTRTV